MFINILVQSVRLFQDVLKMVNRKEKLYRNLSLKTPLWELH